MMRVVLFGGIHDGLEFEIEEGAEVLVMPSLPIGKVPYLFKEDEILTIPDNSVGEDRVTYGFTGKQSKDERWIYQII